MTESELDEDAVDPIDAREIFDIIRQVMDIEERGWKDIHEGSLSEE